MRGTTTPSRWDGADDGDGRFGDRRAPRTDRRRDGDRRDGRPRKARQDGRACWDPRDGFSAGETADILGVDRKRVEILEDRACRKFTGRLLAGMIEDPPEHLRREDILAEALLDPATCVLLGAGRLAGSGDDPDPPPEPPEPPKTPGPGP